jgi:hypothetical protein
LTLEPSSELLDACRLAPGEDMERNIIEHRRKLIHLLDTKWLQHQPL